MSKEALAKVVQRAISDAAFRRQLNSDPAGALRGFNLTADEMSAVRTGDAGRLSALGIDQRVSKVFAVAGGTIAATKVAASDLSSANTSVIDDGSATGSPTIIPHDPESTTTADADGGAASGHRVIRDDPDGFLANVAATGGTGSVRTADAAPLEGSPEADAITQGASSAAVRTGDDWKFAEGRVAADSGSTAAAPTGDDWKFAEGRVAADTGDVRTGDDWKYADDSRGTSQAHAAPVEGSPEAAAMEQGSGMANYPAHHGLAGPSETESARVGDDWARAGSASLEESARFGTARLDDASSGPAVIRDDPDGLLANMAAREADANAGPAVIRDDPDGLLANMAAREASGGSTPTYVDVPDMGPGQQYQDRPADVADPGHGTVASGGSTSPTTDAFIDESSEGYLNTVGYDPQVKITTGDATWSGDENAGPAVEGTDGGDTLDEGGPNITP